MEHAQTRDVTAMMATKVTTAEKRLSAKTTATIMEVVPRITSATAIPATQDLTAKDTLTALTIVRALTEAPAKIRVVVPAKAGTKGTTAQKQKPGKLARRTANTGHATPQGPAHVQRSGWGHTATWRNLRLIPNLALRHHRLIQAHQKNKPQLSHPLTRPTPSPHQFLLPATSRANTPSLNPWTQQITKKQTTLARTTTWLAKTRQQSRTLRTTTTALTC
mmetsp:Transcript_31897/g.54944  ORF Transcript_31897/g.54944 Transcript_31897/m.54944 type:complete len:220 (-) Transcript_31897:563-1222(-)